MKVLNNQDIFSIVKNKTLAIVGSSPILKNSKMGNFIDTHDLTIRFNDAVLYYKDDPISYGSKCDIWAISGWSSEYDKNLNFKNHLNFYNTHLPYILGTRPLDNNNPKHQLKGLQMRGPIFDMVKEIDCNYINIPKEIFNLDLLEGNFNISSGLATILFLLHYSPKNISLLGFNFFDYNQPTHFWENIYHYTKEMKEKSIGHNGEFEHTVINHLINHLKIINIK